MQTKALFCWIYHCYYLKYCSCKLLLPQSIVLVSSSLPLSLILTSAHASPVIHCLTSTPPVCLTHTHSAEARPIIFIFKTCAIFDIIIRYNNFNFISRKLAINKKVKTYFLFTSSAPQLIPEVLVIWVVLVWRGGQGEVWASGAREHGTSLSCLIIQHWYWTHMHTPMEHRVTPQLAAIIVHYKLILFISTLIFF